jgi:hypothetical protein
MDLRPAIANVCHVMTSTQGAPGGTLCIGVITDAIEPDGLRILDESGCELFFGTKGKTMPRGPRGERRAALVTSAAHPPGDPEVTRHLA